MSRLACSFLRISCGCLSSRAHFLGFRRMSLLACSFLGISCGCPTHRLFAATPLRPVSARWFMAPAVLRGPKQEHIETCVTTALQPAYLEVTNESHGRQTDESRFHVFVVSDAFEGKKAIARLRLVSQLLTGSDGTLNSSNKHQKNIIIIRVIMIMIMIIIIRGSGRRRRGLTRCRRCQRFLWLGW